MQGGPGCDSLIGALTENGAWEVEKHGNGTLKSREFSWNRQANMLFLSSPVGVGASYSSHTTHPTMGDNSTSDDSYHFLRGWLEKFPEFKHNDFFVSGESYGGHYTVQLSARILDENKKRPASERINLKGMLVGNPWTSDVYDGGSTIDWIYNHALASKSTYDEVQHECGALKLSKLRGRDFLPPRDFLRAHEPADMSNVRSPASCNRAQEKFSREVGDRIDQYDIYTYCDPPSERGQGYFGCENYEREWRWLNTRAVQKALHMRVAEMAQPWQLCSTVLNYDSSWPTVVPLYKQIIPALEHVMVYSGDVTFNCGFLGSERWIASLNMKKVVEWQAYTTADDQVAGYHESYAMTGTKKQFTFATVRDAGHMCPHFQPGRSFEMLSRYLDGRF